MTRTEIQNKPLALIRGNLHLMRIKQEQIHENRIIQSLTDDLEAHAKQTEDGVKFFWPAIFCACLVIPTSCATAWFYKFLTGKNGF